MTDNERIERLIDDFADGAIDREGARELLQAVESSEDVRRKAAYAAVVERLLRALGKGGVAPRRIVEAIEAGETSGRLDADGVRRGRRKVRVRRDARGGLRSASRVVPRRDAVGGRSFAGARAVFTAAGLLALVAGASWFAVRQWPWSIASSPLPPVSQGKGPVPPASVPVPGQREQPPEPPAPAPETPVEQRGQDPRFRAFPFPLDPPPPPVSEDLSPPSGDGSDEPGFVSPPEAWLAEAARRVAAGTVGSGRDAAGPGGNGRRGPKPPVLCAKVRMGPPSHWAVTPDDLSSLLDAVHERLGLDYGMAVRSLDELDPDPSRNPILFFTGHYHFVLSPDQRTLLRHFILNGGMLVFSAGLGSRPFYDSARRELRHIFPELPVQRLGPDHPLHHAYYDLDRVAVCRGVRDAGHDGDVAWLEGITLSCRTAAVVSRWGVAAGWQGREEEGFRAYRSEDAVRLGVNLLSYGAAVRAWAKRASHAATFVDRGAARAGKMFMAQLIHGGEWKTRYAGLPILLHTFNRRTEVPVTLRVTEMHATSPQLFNVPLLYATGHESFVLDSAETESLRRYLTSGGFLFAEACCGRRGFDRAFREAMSRVLPGSRLEPIAPDAVVFRVPNRIELLGVTPPLADEHRTMLIRPRLEGIRHDGNYVVIYSPYGLAGGWEMSQTPYARGYEDPEALKLGQNVLMYAITQ